MAEKRRILLTVAYDGTDYHGWQIQEGVPTIEGFLAERLRDLTGEETEITGASRTDAGVHARGNLAVFDTMSRIPAEKFPAALNTRLPDTIRVLSGREVAADFHPRHCDSRKTYEYRILNTVQPNPLRSRYTYWYYGALDADAMHTAAQALVGEHDFTSFCSVHAQSETRVREIYEISVKKEKLRSGMPDCREAEKQEADPEGTVAGENVAIPSDGEVVIRVTGSGFLYNMVRIIAGTLIDVGRGHTDTVAVARILEARDRQLAGPTAPPQGLTLIGYEFCRDTK